VSPSKRPSQSCHNFVVEECPVQCVNTGKICTDRCQQYHNVGVSNGGDFERIIDDQTLDQCEAACIAESFGCQEYEYDTVGGKCKLFSFYSLVFDESDTTKITGLCSRTSAPTEFPTGSSKMTNDNDNTGGLGPEIHGVRAEIYIPIILVCVVGFGLAVYLCWSKRAEVAKSDLEIGQKQLPTANSPSISLNRKISLQKIVDFSFSSNDCTGGALFGEGEESHVQISE